MSEKKGRRPVACSSLLDRSAVVFILLPTSFDCATRSASSCTSSGAASASTSCISESSVSATFDSGAAWSCFVKLRSACSRPPARWCCVPERPLCCIGATGVVGAAAATAGPARRCGRQRARPAVTSWAQTF
eukprot:6204297-Pleurochrysis_carterae.AAC.5